jgi:hypothetical protein
VADAQAHDVAAGRRVLAGVAALARRRAQLAARVPAPARRAAATGQAQAFAPTDPGMALAAGEAAALEGQWTRAVRLLGPLTTDGGSVGGEAGLWLGLSLQRLHRAAAAAQALATARSDLGGSYAGQYSLAVAVVGKLAAVPAPRSRR